MCFFNFFKANLNWFTNNYGVYDDVNLNDVAQFVSVGDDIDLNKFSKAGIVIVKGVLSQREQDYFIRAIKDNLLNDNFKHTYKESDYYLSTISDIKEFVDFVVHPNVNAVVNKLIGANKVFVGHDSVSHNYSVTGLHDDQNTHRKFLATEEYPQDFKTVRVLTYLSSANSAPQRFGFVPGSHLRRSYNVDSSYSKRNTLYIEASHGTTIFFDPRLVHTSSPLTHEKNMVVATYDIDNEYTKKVFELTSQNRNQGTKKDSKVFWNILDKHNLKPSFINIDL